MKKVSSESRSRSAPILGNVGELHAIVAQNRMNTIRRGADQVSKDSLADFMVVLSYGFATTIHPTSHNRPCLALLLRGIHRILCLEIMLFTRRVV